MGLFGFKKGSKKEGAKDDKNKSKKEAKQKKEQSSVPKNDDTTPIQQQAAQQNASPANGQHPAQQQQQQQPPALVTDIPVGDPALATPNVTRDLVKKFISDIWNRGEVELIPEVCSPKIRFNGMNGLDKIGHEGFALMVSTIHASFTDYHCEIHSMVVENNKAFCRLRFSGKFTGQLMGYQPHGKMVSWMGASEFTCANGLILKVWELGDMKTLEEQLANRVM